MLESVNRRIADDVPELAGKREGEDESDSQAIERPDDAVAQFLQMLHEGHAQHACPLPHPPDQEEAEEAEVAADAG